MFHLASSEKLHLVCNTFQMNKRSALTYIKTLTNSLDHSHTSLLLGPSRPHFFFTMSSPDPQVEKSVNNAANHTKESAESSDDMFLGPPEHKLQRQLKNRHIAMIRFAKASRFPRMSSHQFKSIQYWWCHWNWFVCTVSSVLAS